MKRLQGKVAFVTGGVSGIGLGIAKALLDEGMAVVLTYRRRDHLDRALAVLGEGGSPRVHAIELDVSDRRAMQAAAAEAAATFGAIHLLCNNAGANLFGPMDQATFDDWDWILDVNLGGVVNGVDRSGMDPMEVGRRAVAGIKQNKAYIFTHSESRDELEEIHAATLAALPQDAPDEARLAVEGRRRGITARARDRAVFE
jgi:NAD(P)-dependent dehydrogenase (short-subunit alcohol dehydrogenase family)